MNSVCNLLLNEGVFYGVMKFQQRKGRQYYSPVMIKIPTTGKTTFMLRRTALGIRPKVGVEEFNGGFQRR